MIKLTTLTLAAALLLSDAHASDSVQKDLGLQEANTPGPSALKDLALPEEIINLILPAQNEIPSMHAYATKKMEELKENFHRSFLLIGRERKPLNAYDAFLVINNIDSLASKSVQAFIKENSLPKEKERKVVVHIPSSYGYDKAHDDYTRLPPMLKGIYSDYLDMLNNSRHGAYLNFRLVCKSWRIKIDSLKGNPLTSYFKTHFYTPIELFTCDLYGNGDWRISKVRVENATHMSLVLLAKNLETSQYPNLETLEIVNCEVKGKLGQNFFKLTTLEHLKITDDDKKVNQRSITRIPPLLSQLQNLKTLDLRGHRIENLDFPEGSAVPSLTALNLSTHGSVLDTTELSPESFNAFPNLEVLNITNSDCNKSMRPKIVNMMLGLKDLRMQTQDMRNIHIIVDDKDKIEEMPTTTEK